MLNQDILAGPIEFALQETIKKYKNHTNNADAVIFEVLKRSETVWSKIRIGGLDVYGLSYDEFCKQCEEKPNILFLSDEDLAIFKQALEVMKAIGFYKKEQI